ncbi:MAG: hypothetical protein QNJ75_00710 [Acidimicrobiia bacterium]|nr:hypothetical protein [Acidimicrobiia bacterium]
MPAPRTEVTEIVTGLATMGFPNVARALEVRPRNFLNVENEHYSALGESYASEQFTAEFDRAWENGVAFAQAADGLRGRPPWSVEWKGNQRPPGYEQIPADLRIDHVYLISCKYGSNILHNPSPGNLFVNLLLDREYRSDTGWYQEVAPDAYQAFYLACRAEVGTERLPARVTQLEDSHLRLIREGLPRRLSGDLGDSYTQFSHTVAAATAQRWASNMRNERRRETMLWRLLRLESAPYFVLGESADRRPLQYRVATPWDFRLRYSFRDLLVSPNREAQQPVVHWKALVHDRAVDAEMSVEGHVEIRWSHGRFGPSPEAKVYLDTPHHDVPGYFPLDEPAPETQPDLRLFD